jgi:hypothetical protein
MSVERILYCEAPDCERHVRSASPPPYIPGGFLEVRQSANNADSVWHFCGWDCAMRFAATQEPEEVVR